MCLSIKFEFFLPLCQELSGIFIKVLCISETLDHTPFNLHLPNSVFEDFVINKIKRVQNQLLNVCLYLDSNIGSRILTN